ncbi:MAG: hypothetical protein KKD48_04600 [Nanoarchaeota archaeon]|nr:hypothetical protein [Nanoarchaeota archaeon]
MKHNRNKKLIILNEKDSGYNILLYDDRFNEYMNIKILWTKKGFGIQVFSEKFYEDTRKRPLNIVVGERGEQSLFKETYAAIWKLIPKYAKKLRKQFD